ncbi:MAG: D-alanyl-D-alanine carboxypeptidase [Ruminococcus sp.]|nr:D-alanyl-D-alanine carboxypeptidase [Ruminococcus sp.]
MKKFAVIPAVLCCLAVADCIPAHAEDIENTEIIDSIENIDDTENVETAGNVGNIEVSAKAAVVISADTGEIIYSHNSSEKLPMASTTKIMSVLLTLESGGLDIPFVVDSDAIRVEGSSMGLQEGDTVTKYALCCGMLLPSGNDAANAAAVAVAGSIEKFADMMNKRAQELGLSKTYFVTPSGLEGTGHGSSAEDMAVLAAEALKNKTFREICSSETIKLEFGNPPFPRWLKNTNKLLSLYSGTYGVKTGFTDEAGRCLVSACCRDGKNLVCVTLNDPNDWNDHMNLYDFCFNRVETVIPDIPQDLQLDLAGSYSDKINVTAGGGIAGITIGADGCGDLTYTVSAPPFVYAPVSAGDELAELIISLNGREIRRIPLYAAENAEYKPAEEKKKKNIADKFISKVKDIFNGKDKNTENDC